MRSLLLASSLLFASCFTSQGQVLIRVLQGNIVTPVANGGSVSVGSLGIGQPKSLSVTITYIGSTTLAFPQAPQLLGAQDFSVTSAPPLNAVLNPNESLTVQLTYLPSSSQSAVAELDYGFLQSSVQTTPTATQPNPAFIPPQPGIVAIVLNGTTPEFSLSYVLALDNNVVNLPQDGVLPFTDTPVNGATLATMLVVNRGSGGGQVLSASVTGDAFSLASLPLIPVNLASGANLQFLVRYQPRQVGTDTGTLNVAFAGGTSYSINLRGHGISSYLSYELLPPSGDPQVFFPNQVVAMPATAVLEKSTVFVRIRNSSLLDITVNGIAVSGISYQLRDLPFLPVTLAPGEQRTFTIVFAPTQAGKQLGRLQVGNDSFELSGEAIGPILTYSYRNPAGVTSVQPLGALTFPGVQVGQVSPVEFTIKNTGTAPAPIINIGIVSDGKAVFTLSKLPALPTAIEPDASLTFTILFTPLATGPSSASLRINTDAFTLTGIAAAPEPFPDYTISGSTTVQAFEQPTVSLTLAAAYSVALTGTLTLSSESDSFVSDPSVLFVTGGKVASFTIPAGTTKAVFSNGSTELRYQTGSVAGTIIITPAFATQGGQDLTPESPKRLRASLAAVQPKLFSLSADSRTNNGFTLQAVGYTTTRSLTKITVSFKVKPGYNYNLTEITQDITARSFLWFNSQASAAFGGQFVVQIPVTLSSSDSSSSAVPPIQTIESVSVTVSNEKGASTPVTVLLQ
ncbi:choice-of-anchor D domain-containing protein [Paludibaculum fermentans]|uniref:choice-of-anchor D domain-containing protein n=1 Tax=Paludibaculum fermentans TaxID=1473598 RepID=UPI003EBF04E6